MEYRAFVFGSLKHCRRIIALFDVGNEGTMFEMLVVIISICAFSCSYYSFLSVPKNWAYKHCSVIFDALFLGVLFSYLSHSEFPVLTHSLTKMIAFEKN